MSHILSSSKISVNHVRNDFVNLLKTDSTGKCTSVINILDLLISLLTVGKKTFKVSGERGTYIGEVNERGIPHGKGVFTHENERFSCMGTFVNNQIDGYCKTTFHF